MRFLEDAKKIETKLQPNVIRCPKCGGPGGVELFTSISPCDACLNPLLLHGPQDDDDPSGGYTLFGKSIYPPKPAAPSQPLRAPLPSTAVSVGNALAALWVAPSGFGLETADIPMTIISTSVRIGDTVTFDGIDFFSVVDINPALCEIKLVGLAGAFKRIALPAQMFKP